MANISPGANSKDLEMQIQEYERDFKRITSYANSLKPGMANDLRTFEESADQIKTRWSKKNKEYYARLTWEVCKSLSSGRFNDDRQYLLARKYALDALTDPNDIPLEVELELTGHVITPMVTPRAPQGDDWVQQRIQDVNARLHASRRLVDAIDPNWDPNDLPQINISPPAGVLGGRAGMSPEDIKDLKLRAEYEAAIEANRQKAERYREQSRLRKWLRRFPPRAEEYIIAAYSKPPFNMAELRQYLEKYAIDKKAQARILDAVAKNMEQAQKQPTTP
jgi:hypothetical protein